MSSPLPEFQRFQYAFAAHLRDPYSSPCPVGVETHRMAVYTRLVYNNLESFLLPCFPVLREVLGTQQWARLVRSFLATHGSRSPFFRQIPDEFIQFLQTEEAVPATYPPFLLELAHYEWIELVLSISSRVPDWEAIEPEGDLLLHRPVLNPVLANLSYRWPVHRIGQGEVQPATTHLLVFRGPSDEVQFTEINAYTARLINLLESGEYSGQAALEIVAEESNHPMPQLVIKGGLDIMHDLQARGALLGVMKPVISLLGAPPETWDNPD
ncbi:hypothetical protein C8R31_103111 [Nitrosospira sp. Nsp2]|uniref:HvfC family RiPP maturation protein n=1 Tax=Nitrosospira sp. Nsp2 TaxID=136548 RepID=UPI000D309E26|nr:putative DNA-binding domain-containing protein [Nitrosospira sp. Nsp2]PTR15527.1 hypothetical protein C8R31_103111 [Nitrosospira sp. Nsp2]